jgi:F420-non-reducing hydrogenase large subunit
MVDENNASTSTTAKVRVVARTARIGKYAPNEYTDWIAEHVEPWTYLKFPYLKKVGWKGFVDGKDSGVYCATPLSRLNAADGMATPRAQEEYEKFYSTLGGKPVHQRLATHWARLIELLYAAERMGGTGHRPGDHLRQLPHHPDRETDRGRGHRRGAARHLTHHYWTDERGMVTRVNLIVGTTNNYAPISMSIKKAAQQPHPKGHGGHRGPAQHGGDGLPRLRPLLRLRHPLPARPDAAGSHHPRRRSLPPSPKPPAASFNPCRRREESNRYGIYGVVETLPLLFRIQP